MRKQYTIAVFLGIFVAVLFYLTLEEHFVRKKIFNDHRKKLETSLDELTRYYFNGNLNYLRHKGLDNNFIIVDLLTKKIVTDSKWPVKNIMDELQAICKKHDIPFFHHFSDHGIEFLVHSRTMNNLLFIVFRDMSVTVKIIEQHKVHFIIFLFFLLCVVFMFIKFITDENVTEPYKKVLKELMLIQKKGLPHKIDIHVKTEFQEIINSFNDTVGKLLKVQQELKEKNEFIQQQISLASKVQKAFLPSRALKDPKFMIKHRYKPAVFLSGDFFGFKKSQGYVYFYIGDISGKGLSSSLIMSAVSTLLLQTITISAPRPDDIIFDLNDTLEKILPDDKFITLQLYRYSPDTGILEYSNAGHPPPFRLLANKAIAERMPEIPSAPIGFFKSWHKNYDSIKVSVGDKLLLYTDGLTELRDRTGKLLHKFDLFSCLNGPVLKKSSDKIVDSLFENVKNFTANAEDFQDDLTIFIFERLE